jgi:hypothetical protein
VEPAVTAKNDPHLKFARPACFIQYGVKLEIFFTAGAVRA